MEGVVNMSNYETVKTEVIIEVPVGFTEEEINSAIENVINSKTTFKVVNFGDFSKAD